MLSFEGVYRKRGGTFLADILGDDPLDFWLGRFYVGVFGVVTIGATILGIAIIALSIAAQGDGDLLRVTIGAPLREYGLHFAPFYQGGNWELIIICATVAFVSKAARETGSRRSARFRRTSVPGYRYGSELSGI